MIFGCFLFVKIIVCWLVNICLVVFNLLDILLVLKWFFLLLVNWNKFLLILLILENNVVFLLIVGLFEKKLLIFDNIINKLVWIIW